MQRECGVHARGLTVIAVASAIAFCGCCVPDQAGIEREIIADVVTHCEIAGNLKALSMPGGRLSGSPNGEKAEAWMAEKLRAYRLENVHFEPFDMISWRDTHTSVTLLGDEPVKLEGAQALGNSLSTPPEGVTAEVVDVGKGTAEDFAVKEGRLAGKFVMARQGGPHRGKVMDMALEAGAAGMLHVSDLEDRVIIGNCHHGPRPEPGLAITKRDGDMLAARMAAGETVRLNVKIEADAWDCRPRNVVAEIPGRGPDADEIVLVGAHLDSWHLAEGALDNGTGTTTILEVARVLSGLETRPNRTIRFVWFMGEEHGLHGSRAYVEAHRQELDRIVAMINVDMPGEPRGLVYFGHPEIVPMLETLGRDLPAYELDPKIRESRGCWSDQGPFWKAGVCCVVLSGDLGPGVKFYHTAGDTYDQVDRRGLAGAAVVLAVLTERLANCPKRPSEKHVGGPIDVGDDC